MDLLVSLKVSPANNSAILAVIAGSLSFFLPETIGKPMTATTEEFIALYGKQSPPSIVEKYTKKDDHPVQNGSTPHEALENPSFKDSEL